MEDTTIEDVLKTVEALHAQKDYKSAIHKLETNQSKISPGVWHYNMGSVHGKLENWSLSRFHFLMAELNGYSTKELMMNKKLVESKLSIEKYEKPISTTDYLIKGSLIASQGILTMVSFLIILFAIYRARKVSELKSLALTTLFAGFILVLNFWILSWTKVVVFSPQMVREGPSVIFRETTEVPAGIMLVISKEGEWSKIIYPSRFEGWTQGKNFRELK